MLAERIDERVVMFGRRVVEGMDGVEIEVGSWREWDGLKSNGVDRFVGLDLGLDLDRW